MEPTAYTHCRLDYACVFVGHGATGCFGWLTAFCVLPPKALGPSHFASLVVRSGNAWSGLQQLDAIRIWAMIFSLTIV